jgi:uncharacterized RDD family membrane protein YckC
MSQGVPLNRNPFASPENTDLATGVQEEQLQYAGFLARFGAALIDGILQRILGVVVMLAVIFAMPASNGTTIVANILSVLVGWLYSALMESSDSQATLGKMAVGIRVASLDGKKISFGAATCRYFGKFLSVLILMIGFLMPLWTRRKQALHDIIAGTLVIKK